MSTLARTRPTPERVAEISERIKGARSLRDARKKAAEDLLRQERADADREFAEAIAEARQERVQWPDLEIAAGLTRQILDGLVRRFT